MAAKQTNVILLASGLRPTGSIVFDQRYIGALQSAVDELSTYVKSGDLLEALYMLDEPGVVNRVKGIVEDWGRSTLCAPPFQIVEPKAMSEAEQLIKRTEAKIIEAQSVINNKLEEL